MSSKASGFLRTSLGQKDPEINSVAFQVKTNNSSFLGVSENSQK